MDPAAASLTGSTTSLDRNTPTGTPTPLTGTLTPSQMDIQALGPEVRTDEVAHEALTSSHVGKTSPTPLETRVTVEKPVHAFKTTLEGAKEMSAEEIKEYKKNATNAKIKKIALIALVVLAAVIVTAGIGAACVFCPPIAAVVLSVAFTVIATGGVAFAIAKFPQNVPEGKLEELQKNGDKLDKALKLFEDYPVDPAKPGSSFEEFLEECPKSHDNKLGPSYKLEDLDKYTDLFEKKLRCDKKHKEINTQEREIRSLEGQIDELAEELDIEGEDPAVKIATLERQNADIQQERASQDPSTETDIQAYQDQLVLTNQATIAKLREYQAKSAELERTQQQLTSSNELLETLNRDFDSGVEDLQLAVASLPTLPKGRDGRVSDERLQAWQSHTTVLRERFTTINRDGNSIYLFGNAKNRPSHGMLGPDPAHPDDETKNLKGVALRFHDSDYKELGRTTENNFLSNGYTGQPLIVDGQSYKSVTHYLLLQALDKIDTKNLKSLEKMQIEGLRKNITNATEQNALIYARRSKFLATPSGDFFVGMDAELKKALYYKFIGPNGEPTKEGKALLATGSKTLYAGEELGSSTYGVKFVDNTKVYGQNKLGVYLMEIRGMLKEDLEQRRTAITTPHRIGVTTVQEEEEEEGEFHDAQTDLDVTDLDVI